MHECSSNIIIMQWMQQRSENLQISKFSVEQNSPPASNRMDQCIRHYLSYPQSTQPFSPHVLIHLYFACSIWTSRDLSLNPSSCKQLSLHVALREHPQSASRSDLDHLHLTVSIQLTGGAVTCYHVMQTGSIPVMDVAFPTDLDSLSHSWTLIVLLCV